MRTKILLPALALLMVLASCSNTRYGRVPKVRSHQAVAQKAPKKQRYNEKVTIALKKAEIEKTIAMVPAEVVKQDIATPVKTETVAIPGGKAAKNNIENNAAPKQNKSSRHFLSPQRQEKVMKQLKTQDTVAVHSWIWYIIVGLIFILLAVLIPWPIGWIFYIVGVIAIIFGLLALLGIV